MSVINQGPLITDIQRSLDKSIVWIFLGSECIFDTLMIFWYNFSVEKSQIGSKLKKGQLYLDIPFL